MINFLDMRKIIANTDNVVIGSGTLEENKFQVLNFMNMLYDNINEPEKDKCMTIDVVRSNLEYEIKRLLKVKKSDYYDYDRCVFGHISAIYHNVKCMNKDNTKVVTELCNTIWDDLLYELRGLFGLEYTINE